jgi:hypothetical protein
MPWSIKRDTRCPVTKPFAVIKDSDNSISGCHPTRARARAQQEALYASEGKRLVPQPQVVSGKDFNPLERRDPAGRWTRGGGLASRVLRAVEEGGGTIPRGGGPEPTSGFPVALEGHSSITPDSEFKGAHAEQVLRSWMDQNAHLFDADPSLHVGVWHDTEHGEVVLDPSQVVKDRETAIRLGRERNQQSVWDIAKGEEIPTGGTGGREATPPAAARAASGSAPAGPSP